MDTQPVARASATLWRDRDFMKFWSAETLSLLGSNISFIAIPLVAVSTLNASAFEMGLLGAFELLPFLLLTLIAGVWVDNHRRLPILIGANLGRAFLFGLIPLAAVLHVLEMPLLLILVLLASSLTVYFDLAYQSYLPSLVRKDQLVEGNGKLEGSRSFATLSGPGLGGLLVGALTAPVAVLVDAVSYLVSAVMLLFVRRPEPAPKREDGAPTSLFAQIGVGLRLAVGNVYLRALGIEAAVYNLFSQIMWSVVILHLVRGLHFSPAVVGVVLTATGAGALLGSMVAGRIGRRFGLGPTLIGSIVIANAAPLIIPIASGEWVLAAPLIGLALLINGVGLVIYGIHAVSVRQAAVSSDVLGRTNAGYRFAVTGTAAFGALLGGVLGGAIGPRPTMLIGALGTLASIYFVVRSPVPRLRELSDVEMDTSLDEPADVDDAIAPREPGEVTSHER